MPEPERHLQAVDSETGELVDLPDCPNCLLYQDEIAGLKTEKASWRVKYQNLKRDKDAEARSHEMWGQAVALFTEWRIATNHMRSKWTADRFFLCLPYLRDEGFAMCRAAVWGIAAHPNTKQITPNYVERYDGFELVFRNADTFARYANRGVAIFGKELPTDLPEEE